jgi:hypothetical protein
MRTEEKQAVVQTEESRKDGNLLDTPPGVQNEIVIKDLVKKFDDITAVDGLNLGPRATRFSSRKVISGQGKI